MSEFVIDSMIQTQSKVIDIAKDIMLILAENKSAYVYVGDYDEQDLDRRSIPQNNISFHIYSRIGKTLYGGDSMLARCECKMRIGVPILRRDDARFREVYDVSIRPFDMPRKLKIMEYWPVTSIMSKKQKKEYLTQVINDYTLQGCYFADIDGTDKYINYREAQK